MVCFRQLPFAVQWLPRLFKNHRSMSADAFLSRESSREVDQRAIAEYGMTGLVLMENAGRGCADLLCRLGIGGQVVICCGKGNNAGDGFVMARHLDLRGHDVKVLLCSAPERLRGDASHNFHILRRSRVTLIECAGRVNDREWEHELEAADWIVDALLGTGAMGEPQPPLDMVIQALNRLPAKKLAIDLPSGLDCDTGRSSKTTFCADHTATFVAPKTGFRNPDAHRYLGKVHVLDIGAPKILVRSILQRENPTS